MSDWVEKAGSLLNQGRTEIAADFVAARVGTSGVASTEEALMAYAIADRLLETTLLRITMHKDTASDDDDQNLDTAIGLARAVLPSGHPLLLYFIKRASYYRSDLQSEVTELESKLGQRAA